MSEWIKAEEYCVSVFDGTHDTPKVTETGYKLVTSKNILSNTLDLNSAYYISEEDFVNINKRSKVKQYDILFSMIGTVGSLYFETSDTIDYAIKNIGVFSCGNKEKAEWLYYYLQSSYAQQYIKRYLNGAVQKFLPLKGLREFPVPQFNKELHNRIKILLNIDQKIQINNQINQELEAMAKTLYDYWFVQFDFPDQNGKPYKSSGGKMVYNPELKREIPDGWGVEKLGELIELERGVTYAKSDIVEKTTKDAIGVLRATNITGNVMDLNDLVYLTKDKINNKQIIKQNETLIVMSSGSKEHLGKNAINYYEEVIGFGAFCSKIVPKKYSAFINTFLQSSEFKGYLLKQSMGTNINNLTNSDILDCRIILPKEEILDKFENMVEKNIRLISNNYIQNKELTQLRDWLLPMLMNGQVKVE